MTGHPTTSPRPAYEWPAGKRSAFCFTVDVDAESPYQWTIKDQIPPPRALGQMEQRLFGPRVGIWRLLDLLNKYGIKASFFVPGAIAENHPDLLPGILKQGHEIGLHGYFHELALQASDAEFTEALEASLEIFKRQTGSIPKGFRSPAWEMTPHMMAEVKKRGLYDSSLMGFDHPYDVDGVTEIPVQWGVDDAIFFKFSGGGADNWAPSAPGPILEGWIDEWETLHRFGSLFMLTVHDWISGRAQRIRLLERLLDRILADPTVWATTVGEVAAHHENSVNKDRFQVNSRLPEAIGPRRFGKA